MKNPKEKAKELYDLFLNHSEERNEDYHTKQCATICVEEIIKTYDWNIKSKEGRSMASSKEISYWNAVKFAIPSAFNAVTMSSVVNASMSPTIATFA